MKVIDLLNKIANGEEVPEEISIRGTEYKVGKCWSIENIYILKEEPNSNWLDVQDIQLNTEIEIIEEDKEIEYITSIGGSDHYLHLDSANNMVDKINELIEAVNELKKGK